MPLESFKLRQAGDVTVVEFRDASILDAVMIQRIGQDLVGLIEPGGKRNLVLDFGHVRFLSSQALGMLLTLRRKADQAKAHVVLCRIRPELMRIFTITNLDRMFGFFDDCGKAVESLGGPAEGETPVAGD